MAESPEPRDFGERLVYSPWQPTSALVACILITKFGEQTRQYPRFLLVLEEINSFLGTLFVIFAWLGVDFDIVASRLSVSK